MSLSSDAIDRIVAGVLNKLSGPPVASRPGVATSAPPAQETAAPILEIVGKVVTAEQLGSVSIGGRVSIAEKAIVTPAAWDLVKERRLHIERRDSVRATSRNSATDSGPGPSATSLLITVRNTDSIERVWSEIQGTWRRELLGCPDDAAKLAISELSRGGVGAVLIVAEQTLRAACLANRHAAVKAVPIRDLADVRLARKQIRANVWCFDPVGRTYFEVRNIIREITGAGK